jgi:hypothetical protein
LGKNQGTQIGVGEVYQFSIVYFEETAAKVHELLAILNQNVSGAEVSMVGWHISTGVEGVQQLINRQRAESKTNPLDGFENELCFWYASATQGSFQAGNRISWSPNLDFWPFNLEFLASQFCCKVRLWTSFSRGGRIELTFNYTMDGPQRAVPSLVVWTSETVPLECQTLPTAN